MNERDSKKVNNKILVASGAYRQRSRVAVVVALFLLIYIPSTFNWFSGMSVPTDILRDGALYEAYTSHAVVVRNEIPVVSTSGGFIIPAHGEGERVQGDAEIATVYGNLSPELMDEYKEINLLLLKEQYERLGPKAVLNRDIEAVDKDIGDVINKMIPDANRNSLTGVSSGVESVNNLLLKKAEAYGALETDDPYINSLKDKKRSIEASMSGGSSEIRSPAPGHLSFYVDGYEDDLSPDNIDEMSLDTFDGIVRFSREKRGAAPYNSQGGIYVNASEPFAKVVRDNYYYFLVYAPAAFLNNLESGDRIRLTTDEPYREFDNAEIAIIGEPDADGGFMTIRLNKYLFDFLDSRTVGVSLIEKYIEGLKIPVKFLMNIDRVNGSADVALLKGTYASLRRVRILAANDIYAIIEGYDNSSPEKRVSRYDTYIRETVNIEDGMQIIK